MSEARRDEKSGRSEVSLESADELMTRSRELDPDEMIDSGEIDEPVPHFQFIELQGLVHDLKARRVRIGLSPTDVSERSGLTRAAVSRLENGWNANPTLETLFRYAPAVNATVRLIAEDVDNEGDSPAER